MIHMNRHDVLNLAAAAGAALAVPRVHAAEGKAVFYANITAMAPIMKAFGAGTLPVLELLRQQGVLAPYRLPAAAGYPDWSKPDDAIQLSGVEYVSYLYNTTQVKTTDAPKNYEDLANAKRKGQIVVADPASHSSTISWLVGLKEKVFKTENDWMAFVKSLAANQPMFVASFGPTPAPIESGEKAIGISMPKYIVT